MHALEVKDLSKTYRSGVQALSNINLIVKEGDFFSLLGPNGAGKSTLITILATLLKKDIGQVKIFGFDLDKNPKDLKMCIGVVPQEFNFNIFEKVWQILLQQAGYYGIPISQAKKRAEILLKQLDLWGKRNVQAMRLSGGMKRRLMIARGLMHNPRLLILDEPTAGVDVELRRSMWNFLIELNKSGTTIILTTHYLEEAESLCRNIAIIDKGNILYNTSLPSLLKMLDTFTVILEVKNFSSGFQKALKEHDISIIEDGRFEIILNKDFSYQDLFALIHQHKVEVSGFKNKTNRLEALFMKLVEGKKK